MAGPGGREIGRVSVRVLPDTAAFGRSLSRYLQRIERTTAVRLQAVLDGDGLAADARRLAATAERAASLTVPADVDTARAETAFQRFLRGLSGESVSLRVDLDKNDLHHIQQAGRGFTRLASTTLALGGLTSSASSLAGLGVAIAQVSQSLLLLPAAGAAAGAAIGTLVLGMRGFGDALSSMDDPGKFAAALANLAPSARDAAQTIKDLRPALTGLRLDVQERLFAGMGQTITQLATTYLPALHSGLGGLASDLNAGARGFAAFLAAPQSLADTGAILGNVRAALTPLAPAAGAVAQALRDITTVGSAFLPALAANLATAAGRFTEFIATARQTGQLASWMQGGITAVGQLGQILRDLASIAATVFGALDNSGGGFLAFLTDATGRLAAFLKSAGGTRVLSALAGVAATAGQVLSGVFGTALAQLGPVLANLAPAFTQFLTQLGGALVTALTVAGPLLAQLATFLSQNASWLGPVVIGLGALSALAGPLVSGLTLLSNAVRIVAVVFNGMKLALLSNPFTPIAVAVAALAVLIISNWDTIKTWTVNTFTAVWGFLSWIWETISGWISARVSDIVAAIGWLADLPGKVGRWFRGIYDSAVGALGDLLSWLGGLPGRILSALGDLGSLLLGTGRNIIAGLLNGLKSAASTVGIFLLNLVKDAVGGVLDFLGIASPSRLMARIGGWTAEGFAQGIIDGTPLAARAADRLARAAVFDPTRLDIGLGTTGAGSAVTVQQTINAGPEQSPWAIATAANRQLGYAMRTSGLP